MRNSVRLLLVLIQLLNRLLVFGDHTFLMSLAQILHAICDVKVRALLPLLLLVVVVVMVVVAEVVNLYSVSSSPLMRYARPFALRRDESSEPILSCRYTKQGPGVSVEVSSIPSDPQRRKPDDQTCCDGVVEP